jgi:hypothetical protein
MFPFCVRFEIQTAVITKSLVVWDMTPFSLVKISRHLEGTYRLRLQGSRVNQVINQREAAIGLLLNHEDEGDMIFRNAG